MHIVAHSLYTTHGFLSVRALAGVLRPGPVAVPGFAAWRDWASRDLTPEIAGLAGFCAHVAGSPDTERAILHACDQLEITDGAAGTARVWSTSRCVCP